MPSAPCDFCSAETDEVLLMQLFCGECKQRFFLCESCYRGQGYCGQACRESSLQLINANKQRSYRSTDVGREVHRQREWARRARRADEQKVCTSLDFHGGEIS
jgi:hypothetical protein